jgi:hypothetical protein
MKRMRAILFAAIMAVAVAWPAIAPADMILSPRRDSTPTPAPRPAPVATAPVPVRPVPPVDPGPALSSGEVTVASAALVLLGGASVFALVVLRRRSAEDDEGPDA